MENVKVPNEKVKLTVSSVQDGKRALLDDPYIFGCARGNHHWNLKAFRNGCQIRFWFSDFRIIGTENASNDECFQEMIQNMEVDLNTSRGANFSQKTIKILPVSKTYETSLLSDSGKPDPRFTAIVRNHCPAPIAVFEQNRPRGKTTDNFAGLELLITCHAMWCF